LLSQEVGGRDERESGRANRGLNAVDQHATIVDQRHAGAVDVKLQQGRRANGPVETKLRGGPLAAAGIGLFADDQLDDDALGNQGLGNGGDAGVAEPGGGCQGRARERTLHAQGAKHQAPVLPPDAVTIADFPPQAAYSSPQNATHYSPPNSANSIYFGLRN